MAGGLSESILKLIGIWIYSVGSKTHHFNMIIFYSVINAGLFAEDAFP